MSKELKPCPFCGEYGKHSVGPGVWREHHMVKCGTPNCYGNPQACKTYSSETEAIAAWNRRAPSVDGKDADSLPPRVTPEMETKLRKIEREAEESGKTLTELRAKYGLDDLHASIMNLPCGVPDDLTPAESTAYKIGHRDARHAAAELAAAPSAPASADARHDAALQALVDQAQESDMGYGPNACPTCGKSGDAVSAEAKSLTEWKQTYLPSTVERDNTVREAISYHKEKWPEELSSGVMFFKGQRITKDEFDAAIAAMSEKESGR